VPEKLNLKADSVVAAYGHERSAKVAFRGVSAWDTHLNRLVAVKLIPCSSDAHTQIQLDVRRLSSRGWNTPHVLPSTISAKHRTIVTVMRYVTGGSLRSA